MNKSVKRGVAVTVALLLLSTIFGSSVGAWDSSYPELWKQYQNQYVDYFPLGISAQSSDVDVTGGTLDLNGHVGHHFNALTVVDFSIAAHMGEGNDNKLFQIYDQTVKATFTTGSPFDDTLAVTINRAVPVTTSAAVVAVLEAIRAHNADPANVDDQRYVRADAILTNDSRTPLYFFCNGFQYDSANPNWADRNTIERRTFNYVENVIKAYSAYADVIAVWDIMEDLYDYSTSRAKVCLTGKWGQKFPYSCEANDLYTNYPGFIEWTNNGNTTDYLDETNNVATDSLIRGIYSRAAANVPAGSGVYWTESFSIFDNTAADAKLAFIETKLNDSNIGPNISGFGINAHLASGVDATNTLSQLQKQMNSLSSLKELAITKLDVRTDLTPGGVVWLPTDAPAAIDVLTVDIAVMKNQADYLDKVMQMFISNSAILVSVNLDGIADDKNSNPLNGASLWSSTSSAALSTMTIASKSALYMEKWGFFAVLGAPVRVNLDYAINTGPAVKGKYTQVTWDRYKKAKDDGQVIYDDGIYSIDDYNKTKDQVKEIWDAYKALKEEVEVFELLCGIFVPVHFWTGPGTYQIEVNTNGVAADFKYEIKNENIATVDDFGVITLIRDGMTPVTVFILDGSGRSRTFVLSVEMN